MLLALRSEGAARYFGRVFRADWRGGAWRIPLGVLVALAVATAGALWLARRFEFERRERENELGDGRVGW